MRLHVGETSLSFLISHSNALMIFNTNLYTAKKIHQPNTLKLLSFSLSLSLSLSLTLLNFFLSFFLSFFISLSLSLSLSPPLTLLNFFSIFLSCASEILSSFLSYALKILPLSISLSLSLSLSLLKSFFLCNPPEFFPFFLPLYSSLNSFCLSSSLTRLNFFHSFSLTLV
ncbi:unnamed protein product [Acanthosepion pharaonis]|uniref:Uncharacterized protein n=1 Tax=Acanthosepion pharaonis TaxID=158019 RepID=A0A812DQP5_ACAPH|nr:unnamed protein product [Sepia pharaonis]